LAVGVAVGEWFFHLFLKAVPPVALSQFNSQSSRIAHWLYGGGVGVVLFLWGLLGMAANRMLSMMSKSAAKS
jgi:hypothetical protein